MRGTVVKRVCGRWYVWVSVRVMGRRAVGLYAGWDPEDDWCLVEAVALRVFGFGIFDVVRLRILKLGLNVWIADE